MTVLPMPCRAPGTFAEQPGASARGGGLPYVLCSDLQYSKGTSQ